MDEQGPGALDHRAALGQVALERVKQRGAAAAVVGDQLVDGDLHAVPGSVRGGDVDEVAVGADLRVGDRAPLAEQGLRDRAASLASR